MLPGEPFRDRQCHYGYWSNGEIWILSSAGPDHHPDADLAQLGVWLAESGSSLGWPAEYLANLYDPTNGITSRGDILKTGP